LGASVHGPVRQKAGGAGPELSERFIEFVADIRRAMEAIHGVVEGAQSKEHCETVALLARMQFFWAQPFFSCNLFGSCIHYTLMGRCFDNEAIELLQDKEPDAIQAWFESFADSVYTFVYYRVGKDEQVASDVVQETFLDALTRIEQYDPERGSMEVWLTTLSRNFISRALKTRGMVSLDQIRSHVDRELRGCFERLATEPLPQDILEKKEMHDLVYATLASIPGNYKMILTLYYHRGLSLRDIASKANKSEGAVKVLLHRARQAFKETFLRLSDSGLCQGGQS